MVVDFVPLPAMLLEKYWYKLANVVLVVAGHLICEDLKGCGAFLSLE